MAKEFQLKALILGVDKLSPTIAKARKSVMGFRKQLLSSGLGKPISIQDIVTGGALVAPFIAGAKAAIGFESSMADVRKVVDFDTPQQFAEMGQDILKMSASLPMAAKDIAAIVASGGQAGLAREELGQFAEDAVKMGIAFDQTAEQAGDTMAKWRTSFRIGQDEVVELADKINFLSDTTAANAQQISGIVTRIGSLGEVAGLATGEIAAIGATLASVGVGEEQAATGMKNFILSMTAGQAATKKQKQVFKALRMDASQVAVDMQKDAKGAMIKVLAAISKVDKSKQAGVLQQLFGKESIAAIAPLLTNLDQLQANFATVADSTKYAGSMQREFETRSKTTANAITLLWNRVTRLGITVGSVLLPPLNDFMQFTGPLIDGVANLAQAQPWLINGLLGAGAAFVVMRVAVAGTAAAMRILSMVMTMSPVGLLIRGIALAAGFLVANWSTVGPWFSEMWDKIKAPAQAVWDWMKGAFFNWHPLGIIIKNWEPIVQWFKDMWDQVKKFIDPILSGMDAVKDVTSGISNAASSAVDGVTSGVSSAWGWAKGAVGLGDSPVAAAPASARDTRLDGEMVIRFENAPPGMRADPMKTNQPGLRVNQNVGVRSLAGAS